MHSKQLDGFIAPLERARKWHIGMQNSHPPIEQWLHPILFPYLNTRFEESELEIALSTAERREELDRLAEALGEPDLFNEV